MGKIKNCLDCGKPLTRSKTGFCLSCVGKGKRNAMYGRKHTDESIKKMSIAQSGKVISEETKRKISKNHARLSGVNHPHFGKNPSLETIEKMRLAKIGTQTKENNNNWKGGKVNCHGYVFELQKDGSYKQEHRIIMENHIGRELSNDEIIHHINQDKTDNRIGNLQIMTQETHKQLHNELRCQRKPHPTQSRLYNL